MESEGTDESASVDSLFNMFGGIVSRDVIITVLESCGRDLNLSVDAIMRITSDNTGTENTSNNTGQKNISNTIRPLTTHNSQSTEISVSQGQIATPPDMATSPSYAAAFQNTGAMPKHRIQPVSSNSNVVKHWNNQLHKIIEYHSKGYCTLILLRGAPGSGKSYLAQKIIEMTIGDKLADFKTHVCSADDFFMCGRKYCFNKHDLHNAHAWNKDRARLAIEQGLSPIIIDNTNIEIWEMEPYVRMGVTNGYFIEVLEPDTPWAKQPHQLCRRNVHNVPITSIKRMLDNYDHSITSESLIKRLGLCYPSDKVPPVKRLMPAISIPEDGAQKKVSTITITNMTEVVENKESVIATLDNSVTPSTSQKNENEKEKNLDKFKEIEKQFEEFAKVEQEWDNGENWTDGENRSDAEANVNKGMTCEIPKQQRDANIQSSDRFLENVSECEDWQQISLFMPPWKSDNISASETNESKISVETMSNSTCMEIGDVDSSRNNYKIIIATPRDINEFHMSSNKEKIPEIRMLDKSSMTNEHHTVEPAKRCKSEERHFKELQKLFKNVPKTSLRDVFDQCQGDVNWAVEIVLDGVASKQLKTVDEVEISDEEKDQGGVEDQCTCLAAYSILPDRSPDPPKVSEQPSTSIVDENASMTQSQKKIKKDNNSADSIILKRLIEQNVAFPDSHYSQHCLKIRKYRRGENELTEERVTEEVSNVKENTEVVDGTDIGYQETASCLPDNQSSDDEDSNQSFDEIEKTVNVNVGKEFIASLDRIFGRNDMAYPDKVLPRINIPTSILNELNALWMESLMYQLDEYDKKAAMMFQEDEDFARQLALKEAELALSGKEPEVPDFKEIMDMDFALSLYQKDVAEWRNKEPNDLAAKLTRDKLYNLFPDVQKEILSELLMAHDNNFQSTVEILLMSTGKHDVLKEENGLNKFIVKKEMERQEKILEEERKALLEVDWPLLPRDEVVEMSVVDKYRNEAEQHLNSRNQNYLKANEFIGRGMTQVANHYVELAAFHKLKYEQANSLAAASLIQVNASKCPDSATIDLHYLRVNEAKEALDLFIDTHIQRLKENQGRGPKFRTLFFITGRGLHSQGKPRIKPAVKKRLLERGLTCSERNPGLLSARVYSGDRLSYQES